MTLPEATRRAVQRRDAVLAGRVADVLRFKLGCDYAASYALVFKWSGVSEADWEALMYEADWLAGAS